MRRIYFAPTALAIILSASLAGASEPVGVASVSDRGVMQALASDLVVDGDAITGQSVAKSITGALADRGIVISDANSASADSAGAIGPTNNTGAACGNSGCCPIDCYDCSVPTWTVKAGAVILQRSRPDSAPLAIDALSGEALLNADDFDFNAAGGLDISVRRHCGCDRAIEARYFGIDAWNATRTFDAPSGWVLPTAVPFLAAPGSARVNYASRLYSTEINLLNTSNINPRWNWLFGFRWIQLSDDLEYNINTAVGDALASFDTGNNLYGAQLGVDVRLWDRGGPFRIDGLAKAGVYGNSADQSFEAVVGPSTFLAGESQGKVAFVGEIGLTGYYQVSEHIGIRGGYQLLWLDGVATASDQVAVADFVTQSGINTSGNVFYHGAIMSLDVTW